MAPRTGNAELPAGDAGHDYTIGTPSDGIITIHDFAQLIFKDGFEDL